jgi:hypothetical protein
MKNKIGIIVLSLTLLLLVMSCGPSPREQLKDSGLWGEHNLIRMESFGGVNGSISGSFFLGIGSINGSLGSEFKLQFYWSPKPGEIVITALPYSKFRFIIDETKKVPAIEFLFNDQWLNNGDAFSGDQEKPSPNLNDFIMSDHLQLVRVKISNSALEKEVYLPKI